MAALHSHESRPQLLRGQSGPGIYRLPLSTRGGSAFISAADRTMRKERSASPSSERIPRAARSTAVPNCEPSPRMLGGLRTSMAYRSHPTPAGTSNSTSYQPHSADENIERQRLSEPLSHFAYRPRRLSSSTDNSTSSMSSASDRPGPGDPTATLNYRRLPPVSRLVQLADRSDAPLETKNLSDGISMLAGSYDPPSAHSVRIESMSPSNPYPEQRFATSNHPSAVVSPRTGSPASYRPLYNSPAPASSPCKSYDPPTSDPYHGRALSAQLPLPPVQSRRPPEATAAEHQHHARSRTLPSLVQHQATIQPVPMQPSVATQVPPNPFRAGPQGVDSRVQQCGSLAYPAMPKYRYDSPHPFDRIEYGPGASTGMAENAPGLHYGRKRRGNLPKEATKLLRQWFDDHSDSPYPSEDEKLFLCQKTGLQMTQVNNWFINARRRIQRDPVKAHSRMPSEERSPSNDSPFAGELFTPNRVNPETPPRIFGREPASSSHE